MRLQHLRDLLHCRESGAGLLTGQTTFVNMTLAGQIYSPIFFGGRNSAEQEIWRAPPYCAWSTLRRLRRLVSVCQRVYSCSVGQLYFKPIQLGVGL